MQPVILVLFALFLPVSTIFFGGGGCGCPPPPICLPPIQLPSLCLPQISFPQPCPCGCGRKKRSTTKVVASDRLASSNVKCSDPQIRRIILKHMTNDTKTSKSAVHSELRAKLGGNWMVFCGTGLSSFIADASTYCVERYVDETCHVFGV